MSKQTTLFQTWGKGAARVQESGQSTTNNADEVDEFDDEDDEDLLLAIAESLKDAQPAVPQVPTAGTSAGPAGSTVTRPTAQPAKVQSSLFSCFGNREKGNEPVAGPSNADVTNEPFTEEEPSLPDLSHIPDLPGFDKEAGRMWIYPTNYPVREYQFNIIKAALFENTLVVLPTGLGKTFIAAVVMYNFYRWYPEGKIIFMAPTKPLVAQQIEACFNIMGIPQGDTAEMTGT